MICKYYGRKVRLDVLRDLCYLNREGVSLANIGDAAESIGFRTLASALPLENLLNQAPLPLIAYWNQKHFIVIYKISKDDIYIADPAQGLITIKKDYLKRYWINSRIDGKETGLVLFLEPTPFFYKSNEETKNESNSNWKYFSTYLLRYKRYFVQIVLSLVISMLFAFIAPFLAQSMLDYGINRSDIGFVNLILFSQLFIQLSNLAIDYVRNWITLHIGTRIGVSIISDFLIKLLKLPYTYFENKSVGDILQRIGDHSVIQNFLTNASLGTLFSLINFIVFGIIMIIYDFKIFLIFLLGWLVFFGWSLLFLRQRKRLNYKNFNQSSENKNSLIQLLYGVQEIKLQNCERKKRWEWEQVQARQYKLSMETLTLGQIQQIGGFFLNQTTNIIVSYLAARAVIQGQITLGMMLSISYILGQLNGPLSHVISMVYQYQDAKISLERLADVLDKTDESANETGIDMGLGELPEDSFIKVKDLTFQYAGPRSPIVLDNISLSIPLFKTTAIVGDSGSGKTTFMKLLLKFYEPTSGSIEISGTDLKFVSTNYWRRQCGVVSQDGFLFADTIANNISISDDEVDKGKLLNAVKIANIKEFIDSLPLKYNTKIGKDGSGISQGQKQRLQIARVVYKNPAFIFFDEATNSLDAHNEKVIVDNMKEFLKGKTSLIIAHRLSTVKNADQIVVLKKGKIVEVGTHEELLKNESEYYSLVKEQLQIGS